MDSPLVSIIIPTFNRADIISDTLDSIVLQTYQNWECIIVDDGSTDQTVTVIQQYANKDDRFSVFMRPKENNKGANTCRNLGLSRANGEYIIFFDSDDIMATTCLEKRTEVFSHNQDKDFLVFSMGVFRENLNLEIYPHRKVINLSLKKTLEEFILSDTLPWNVCRPIFKSKLIKGKINFNDKLQNFQDDEFNIRVLAFLNPSYLSIDITDCYYRFDEASLNKYKTLKGTQDIVDCFYEFYNTVFGVFTQQQKNAYKDQLVLKFFNHIRFYVIPGINRKEVFKTLRLFQNELKLSIRDVVLIYAIIILNKFYFNKRGHYFLTSKLKQLLSC